MSISASLSSFEWDDRKINLIDTPGEPSFVADALGALRVCESAIFVVNAVMGVEVNAIRLWQRAEELDLARMVFVNMLDRERADFFRTLESLKARLRPARRRHRDPDRLRARGPRRHRPRRHEGLRVRRATAATTAARSRSPTSSRPQAEEYREKLMDEVAEVSDALMERYLEGEEISHEEIVTALKDGTNHGGIFPVVCGVATRNLGTNRLLDAIVEDLPSPGEARRRCELPEITLEPDEDKELFAYVFKTKADPFAGRINFFRVYQGVMRPDSQVLNTRAHAKERIGTLIVPQGKEHGHADALRARRHRRRRQAQGDARRRLAGRARRADRDARDQAAPAGHGLRDRAQGQGRRGQGLHARCAACRRRTRRSTCTATRRPASRSSPGSRRSTSRSSSTA